MIGGGVGFTWTLITDSSGREVREVLVSAVLADEEQIKVLFRPLLDILCDEQCLCRCTLSSGAGRAAHRLSPAPSVLHEIILHSYIHKRSYQGAS